MTDAAIYATATNCTKVLSVSVDEGYSMISASATIECASTTLNFNDSVSIDIGYSGNHAVVFTGNVYKIETRRPEGTVTVTCYDQLQKAVAYFMASDDPEKPFERSNISSLQLVKDLLAEASISSVSGTEPGFTFGTASPAKFNLQSVSDAVQFIASVTGYTIYDSNGTVQFVARKPYVDGDSPQGNINSGIISCSYEKSSDRIRNKVTVYGKEPIHATASASSAFVVVTQTAVIAHSLIDTDALAQGTANVNLTMLNKLGEVYSLELEGNPTMRARQVWALTESFSGASNRNVFLYRCTHNLSQGGYTTSLTAVP